MLTIKRFVCNMLEENCYVLSDETRDAVIIDCGALYPDEAQRIETYITAGQFNVKHLINTHCHFDHIFGDGFVFRRYGVKPEMHRNDVGLYRDFPRQLAELLGRRPDELPVLLPPVGRIFDAGEEITFGTHRLQVIATPGHTRGGVCFYCAEEGHLFSGDSLFFHSIGRTDFPYGSERDLVSSLRENILTLPPEVVIHPGHGLVTTVANERHNRYLK